MRFKEVLEAVNKGLKIRRKGWNSEKYMFVNESGLLVIHTGRLNNEIRRDINLFELQFTDWEIYKEPLINESETEMLKETLSVFYKMNYRRILWVEKDLMARDRAGNRLYSLRIKISNDLRGAESFAYSPAFYEDEMFVKLIEGKQYSLEELGAPEIGNGN